MQADKASPSLKFRVASTLPAVEILMATSVFLHKHGRERLDNVAQAAQRKTLPPISLVQIGDIYFVQDGHHRVAIATANKQEQIMAQVTVLHVADAASVSAQPTYA